jgi:hypothetical protein
MATIQDFRSWIERDLSRFGKIEQHAIIDRIAASSPGGETELRLRIWTDTHRYSIGARAPALHKVRAEGQPIQRQKLSISEIENLMSRQDKFVELDPDGFAAVSDAATVLDGGYLGCIAVNRKARAGEEWERGSDLADGPLTEETWRKILSDIVSYEMVRVHRQPQPQYDNG